MTEEELNTMSDQELKDLEDSFLLQREMDPSLRLKHTGGRFVLLAMAVAIWVIIKILLVELSLHLKPQSRGVFSAVSFFISIAASGYLSHTIWSRSNVDVRSFVRGAVHYWPATLSLIFGIVTIIKG